MEILVLVNSLTSEGMGGFGHSQSIAGLSFNYSKFTSI